MALRKPSARVRSVRRIADSFLKLDQYEFEVDRFGGGTQVITRDGGERGNSVGVLGYDPVRDQVVLISEFRPGCFVAGDDAFTENLVAGGVGENESPLEAAVREMNEEAGLELRHPILVHSGAYLSSGGTSEKVAIVVGLIDASMAGGVHGSADEAEDILTVVLPRALFLQRVRSGEIADLKTLFAGYWLAENAEKLATKNT